MQVNTHPTEVRFDELALIHSTPTGTVLAVWRKAVARAFAIIVRSTLYGTSVCVAPSWTCAATLICARQSGCLGRSATGEELRPHRMRHLSCSW